jgi:predicted GNAT superfamily acetyltransferase
MNIIVRELTTLPEFTEAERVQKKAWGMEDLMVIPKEAIIAIASNGGIILGAFDREVMVGVSVAFPGRKQGKLYMYSHITGVARELQSKGIGLVLKMKQKELSVKSGYKLLAWTFDPIISRNAYFNFGKLGVVSRTYFVNYYGPMNDAINFGWETDRFLAEQFVDKRVTSRIRKSGNSKNVVHPAIKTKQVDNYLKCLDWSIDLGAPSVLVDIPRDVLAIKISHPEEALRWRMATREVFQAYFSEGFTAIRLLERAGGFSYLLKRVPLPRNIFAE